MQECWLVGLLLGAVLRSQAGLQHCQRAGPGWRPLSSDLGLLFPTVAPVRLELRGGAGERNRARLELDQHHLSLLVGRELVAQSARLPALLPGAVWISIARRGKEEVDLTVFSAGDSDTKELLLETE